MEKDEPIENDDDALNLAFVEGELNKTVTNNSNENSNWNLLDDPQMAGVEEEEVDNFNENYLDVSQK